MSSPDTAIKTCPRCGSKSIIRSHDEVICLVSCGTIVSPVRAWEAVPTPPIGATGRSSPENRVVRWTRQEMDEWEHWREGDPVREVTYKWKYLKAEDYA